MSRHRRRRFLPTAEAGGFRAVHLVNAYRYPAFRPAYRPVSAPRRSLGQTERPTAASIKSAAAGLGLVSTALTGAAAWVGIHAGLKEGGVLSAAGWLVGLTGALFGAISLFGTLGVLLTSNEEIERAIQEAQRATPPAAPRSTFEVSTAEMPILREV